MSSRYKYLLGFFLLFAGCNSKTSTSTTDGSTAKDAGDVASIAEPVVSDPVEAVNAIEAVTKKIRRDSNGAIIDVDFRGLEIKDSDLLALVELPKLRAVRLGGTAVTDEGLGTVGQISSLEDLDLRDCGISDDGLAKLAGLDKLKA
ncbi:MAG: hypothetical protein ACPGPS_21345, partial [Rubripirellula sp.]